MADIDLLSLSLTVLALAFYLIAFILTTRLWLLTDRETYWIGFPIAMFFLVFHELVELLETANINPVPNLEEIFEMVGAFFLIYASFGLGKILAKVNSMLNEKNDVE